MSTGQQMQHTVTGGQQADVAIFKSHRDWDWQSPVQSFMYNTSVCTSEPAHGKVPGACSLVFVWKFRSIIVEPAMHTAKLLRQLFRSARHVGECMTKPAKTACPFMFSMMASWVGDAAAESMQAGLAEI